MNAKTGAGEKIATRDLPPLTLRATIRPGSIDPEKRTVEVVWTTGARVLRGFFDRYYEELSLDPKHVRLQRLNNGAPFLNAHNGYELGAVMGVVEAGSAKLESGKQGTARVRFAKAADDAEADKVFRKIQDGIIQNVSVGYRVHKYEKQEGGDGQIPVYRATDWEPFEISAVPMGADDGAGFRTSEHSATNPVQLISRENDDMDKTPQQIADEKAAADKAQREAAELAQRTATEAATKAERERVQGIQQAVRSAKLPAELADGFIRDGVSLEKARADVLAKLAEGDDKTRTDGHGAIVVTDDETDKFIRGAAAWLYMKSGQSQVIARALKANPDAEAFKGVSVDPGEFRGLSLVDLARMSLVRRGVKVGGMDKVRMVGLALTHRAGGYNSTSDFAVLLETAMHKVLLASYGTTQDTWSRFCSRGTVSDFRAHNRYRLGSFGRLDRLTELGEFKNKSIPDAVKEAITAGTRGNIIGLSRQAVINDDMGAFNSLATMLGRAARLSIEMDVYDLLALNAGLGPLMNDGQTMFHATHNNIAAGLALSAAAIDADRVVMASQKDPSGNEILDLRPAVLLLPVGLGGVARIINQSQYDPDTLANKSQMKPNIVVGLFRDLVDTPRLAGTRRYLFADPSMAPTVEVAFLDGNDQPYLEAQDGWRVDGVEWKIRLDYAVGGVDFRGAVTNAGV
jgi:hypothetical protein